MESNARPINPLAQEREWRITVVKIALGLALLELLPVIEHALPLYALAMQYIYLFDEETSIFLRVEASVLTWWIGWAVYVICFTKCGFSRWFSPVYLLLALAGLALCLTTTVWFWAGVTRTLLKPLVG